MNFIGLPPHTCIAGTNLPGGTTLLGAIIAPYYIIAPSNTTELYPINALYFNIHEYKVHPFCTTQSSWIYNLADIPDDVDAAVCKTQLLPITILLWILFYYYIKLHDSIDVSSDDCTMPYTDLVS